MRLACSQLAAQEMTGITSSQYGGIYSAQLNPALPVLSPLYFDLNIVSANAFIQNNYLYIPAEAGNFFNLIEAYQSGTFTTKSTATNTGQNTGQNKAASTGSGTGQNKIYSDYYTNSIKYAQIQARIAGPSAVLVAGKHAFGVSTALRSVTSVKDMPHTLAKFFYEGLYFTPQYDTRFAYAERIAMATLNWAETGLTYSGYIKSHRRDIFTGGLTIKWLTGFGGAYLNLNNLDYTVPNYDTLIVHNADLDGAYALPMDYTTQQFTASKPVHGTGIGLDAGIAWERKLRAPTDASYYTRLCSQKYVPYLFRVSVSLLDAGTIRFKQNANRLAIMGGSLFWPGVNELEESRLNNLTGKVMDHLDGDPDAITTAEAFSMSLPTTLSLQGDFNLSANMYDMPGSWYANAVIMVPVNPAKASVTQPMLITLGTRYESANFQIGATGSLYNNRQFHLGINGRFKYLFLGTDNLLSFFKVRDFTGTSLYAGLRFSLRKGNCKKLAFQCPDSFCL